MIRFPFIDQDLALAGKLLFKLFAGPRGFVVGLGAAHCVAEEKKIWMPFAILTPGLYLGVTACNFVYGVSAEYNKKQKEYKWDASSTVAVPTSS